MINTMWLILLKHRFFDPKQERMDNVLEILTSFEMWYHDNYFPFYKQINITYSSDRLRKLLTLLNNFK